MNNLPDYCSKSVVVLGCGNVFFGDDGFGPALIDYVERWAAVPEHVCLADAGTGVRKLLFNICLSPVRPRRVVIVDAIDVGRQPGEIFEISPSDLPFAKLDDFSMHQLPTSDLLRELAEECGLDVRILACQSGEIPDHIEPGLTPAVAAAVPRAAERLVLELFEV